MPALIPKEVEIQRLKKIWLIVIAMGSTAASVEVDNFVDGSLHQTSIRDSAFTPAHWWLYRDADARAGGLSDDPVLRRIYPRRRRVRAATGATHGLRDRPERTDQPLLGGLHAVRFFGAAG